MDGARKVWEVHERCRGGAQKVRGRCKRGLWKLCGRCTKGVQKVRLATINLVGDNREIYSLRHIFSS